MATAAACVICISEDGTVTYNGTDIATACGPVCITVAGNVGSIIMNGMSTLNVAGNVTYAVSHGMSTLNVTSVDTIGLSTADFLFPELNTKRNLSAEPANTPSPSNDSLSVGFGQVGHIHLAPGAIAVQHLGAGQIGMDFSQHNKRQR